jgi:hypothetical protein
MKFVAKTDEYSDMTNQFNWNKSRETGYMKTFLQSLMSIQQT